MADKIGLKLIASGHALPTGKYTNNDLKRYMDTDDEWIYTRTGIKERYFCDPDKGEDTAALAAEAAAKAIEDARAHIDGFDISQIGAVIATSCSSSMMLPSIASLVQNEIGLDKSVLAYDLNAACSGFVFGLITARALLMAEGYRYVLLVSSEQLSKQLDLTDRSTGILFGDGAGAVIAELASEDENAAAFTAKAWSDGNIPAISCGAAAAGTVSRESDTALNRRQTIQMNGHDVFRFAASAVPQTIDALLSESGKSLDDIDLVLCHQANARIIDHIKKKYKGHEDKFLMNIDKYGNTSSASIPILLDELRRDGRISGGMRIMCVGFGAGLAWGGAVINV